MPVALPSGWLDTGVAATHQIALTLRLRAQVVGIGAPGLPGPSADATVGFSGPSFSSWQFYVRPAYGATFLGNISGGTLGTTAWNNLELILVDDSSPFDPGHNHVIATGGGALVNPGWLTAGTCTLTVANLRLGVTIENSGALSILRYAWFADAASTETLALAGFTARGSAGTDPPKLSGPLGLGPTLDFWAQLYGDGTTPGTASAYDHVEFSAFTVNGVTVSPPSDPQLYKARGDARTPSYIPNTIGLPFKWRTDLAAVNSDGTAEAANATYGGTTAACPFTVDRSVAQYFGEDFSPVGGDHPWVQQYAGPAVLADPWLSAQTIRPYALEQAFTLEGNQPKNPAAAAAFSMNVGTITIASPLSVLLSANAWSTDLGTVAIGGTPTVPAFNVTGAPAIVKRALSSQWRNWNTVGDPLVIANENYTATKRNAYGVGGATPDVWGWGLYAYLDVDLTPGAAGDIAFEITWAVIREGGSIVTVVRTYTATWGAGRSTRRLDLLFPNEINRPFYGERVDQIRLIGLQVGTYTLNSLSLVTAQDAYLKVGGVRKVNGDGSVSTGGITISQDGQMAICQWGKDPPIQPLADLDGDFLTDHLLDQQNGLMGLVLVPQGPVVTEFLGGAIGATRDTISAVFTELSRMEGVTATYDATALDAALTDSFGNSIGITGAYPTGAAAPVNRSSLWLTPNLPHVRLTAGTPVTLTARLVVDDVSVASGRTAAQMRVYQRQRLGMVIEAQATTPGGNRATAGNTVNLRLSMTGTPSGADPVIATATTDASGFATLPTRNGTYQGSEYWVYLSG